MSVAAALADPTAVAYLRKADPVMAQVIDRGRISGRARGWRSFHRSSDALDVALTVAGGSLGMWRILVAASGKDQRYGGHSEFSEAMGVGANTRSHDVHRIEGAGLVVRKPDPAGLDPGVVHQGVMPELVCNGRDEVLANVRSSFDQSDFGIERLELNAAGDRVIVDICGSAISRDPFP